MKKLQLAELVNHRAHFAAHISYLSLVFIESHGFYGIAAGILGIVIISEQGIQYLIHRNN